MVIARIACPGITQTYYVSSIYRKNPHCFCEQKCQAPREKSTCFSNGNPRLEASLFVNLKFSKSCVHLRVAVFHTLCRRLVLALCACVGAVHQIFHFAISYSPVNPERGGRQLVAEAGVNSRGFVSWKRKRGAPPLLSSESALLPRQRTCYTICCVHFHSQASSRHTFCSFFIHNHPRNHQSTIYCIYFL